MSANFTPGNILTYNPTSASNYNAGTATYNPPTPGTGVNWNSTTYYEVDKKVSAPGQPLEYSTFSTTNFASGYNLTCPVGESNFVTNSYNPGNIATYNPGNANYFSGVAVYNPPTGASGVTWNSETFYEVEKKVSAPGQPLEYSVFVNNTNYASGFSPTCPSPEGNYNTSGGQFITYTVDYTCTPVGGEPGNLAGYEGNIVESTNSTVASYNPGSPSGEGALYEVNYTCTPAGSTPGNLTGSFVGNTIADYNPGSAATYNPPTITGYNPLTPGEAIYTPGNIATYNEGFAIYSPGTSLGFSGNNANYNTGIATFNSPVPSGFNTGGNPATYNPGDPGNYNPPTVGGYNTGSIAGYTGNNVGGFTGNNIASYTGNNVGGFTGNNIASYVGNNANYNTGNPSTYNPTNINGYNPSAPVTYNIGNPATYGGNVISGYNSGNPATYTGNFIGTYTGNFAATYNTGSPATYNPPIPGTPGDDGYAFGVYFPGGNVCAPGTFVAEQEISYYFEGQEIDYKNHPIEVPSGGQIVVRIE